jgi:hypothetical protein
VNFLKLAGFEEIVRDEFPVFTSDFVILSEAKNPAILHFAKSVQNDKSCFRGASLRAQRLNDFPLAQIRQFLARESKFLAVDAIVVSSEHRAVRPWRRRLAVEA